MYRKTYKFRLYPTKSQETKLIFTLNTCRHLYNNSLEERIHNAKINKIYREFQVFPWGKQKWVSIYDQQKTLARNKTEYQKQAYAQILIDVLRRLDKTYKSFYRGNGYPRFQGKNRYDSFTYPQHGFKIEGNKLKLSKIGLIKIKQHREIEGKIKTCTIKRGVDHWYVSFSVEIDKEIEHTKGDCEIGIDVGLKELLTLSNGQKISPQKFYRKSENKIRTANKSLHRKKKGSNNRNKQRVKAGRAHRKIRNQRKDFNHKTSRILVNTYDKIAFEKLQIQNMVKNKHLSKSINDAGWYQLIEMTKYKAEYAGKVVVLVNPHNTSQICSKCGEHVKKSLSVRVHKCPNCGLVLDRDHNAAINILNKVGRDTPELTSVEMINRSSLKQKTITSYI